MKIKAVCESTGLTDRAIRYYIEEALPLKPPQEITPITSLPIMNAINPYAIFTLIVKSVASHTICPWNGRCLFDTKTP